MKMNLSVVMNLKDKTTAPLKAMREESNHYSKAIKNIQKRQQDDSAALGMIDAFKSTRIAMDKNSLAIATANEKLQELEAKQKSANKPSAALTEKITKQREKLNALNASQDESKKRLINLGKQLKKSGVRMYDLSGESNRLNQSYKKHGKEISKLSKKYALLQGAMTPIRKLNKSIKMPTIEGARNAALAGAGVAGSMAGLGLIVSNTASQLDEMANTAGDVKMPVSELQALRLQAKLAGAESEDMDAAIREMMLRWGEMKTTQSGTMNDYFKDTGNRKAYEDLMQAKNASEAYQVLLREIAKETDESKQNFMADEFFGGDSEKMLGMLKGGIEGYTEAKQLLNDTGGAVSKESIKNATEFTASLKKMGAIVDSLKIHALTPIMAELSFIMKDLAKDMKDMEWREGAIKELREIVKSTFNAFKTLGSTFLWLTDNMSTVLGAFAGIKIALVGINVLALANPLGPVLIAIGAITAGVGFLIDRFGGLTAVMDKIKSVWSSIWGEDDEVEKVKELSKTAQEFKRQNAELDIVTHETRSQTERINTEQAYRTYQSGGISSPVYNPYRPITNQTVKSKSEVALTIKSDKPVTVDKAKSEKGTDLNLDVGGLGLSY